MVDLRDRIKGMLYAAALGDALGAPHEFVRLRKNVYTGKLQHRLIFFNRFNNKITAYSVGQVTDDTEMSMCILESLKETNWKYDSKNTVMKYIEWANSGTKSMGRNIKSLFKGIKTYRGYLKRYEKNFCIDKEIFQSNGALMRCGILTLLKDETSVIEDCDLTNPSSVARDCNKIFRHAILSVMSPELTKDKIIEILHLVADTEVLKTYLKYAMDGVCISVDNKHKGWCVYGIYLTFFALKKFDNFKDSIDYIIKQFGDTDTNACIAGYLLGAYYGFEEINKDPTTKENFRIMIECDTSESTTPRPKKYLIKNYLTDENFDLITKFFLE